MTQKSEHTPTLKPCPFCGKAAMSSSITDKRMPSGWGRVVMCQDANNCTVQPMTDSCLTESEAIAAWNTRHLPNTWEAMREALEFIAKQEDYTFAECSLAEEIISRARAALKSGETNARVGRDGEQ